MTPTPQPQPQLFPLRVGLNAAIRYTGSPDTLASLLAPIISDVVVVYYSGPAGQTLTWYPGSPTPTIANGALLTINMRSAATLVILPH